MTTNFTPVVIVLDVQVLVLFQE